MPTNKNSRRIFLKTVAAGSLTTLIIPNALSVAGSDMYSPVSKKEKDLVFLFQGDSITDGNRGRNSDPNHIMGHGYAFSIATRLGCDFPERNLTFINRGISGNKVTDLEKRWKEDCLDLKPDVLSVLIGINDSSSAIATNPMLLPVTPKIFDEVYRLVLDQAVKQNPDIILVLNQPFVFKSKSTEKNWEQRLADLTERQKIVEKIAEDYNAVFVKLQDAFDKACKRAPAEYWIWDGIHPTVAGHELITREWLRQIRKRLRFIKY